MKFVQEFLYVKYMPSIIEYWYSYIKLDLVFFKLSYSKYTDNRMSMMSRRDTRFLGTVQIFMIEVDIFGQKNVLLPILLYKSSGKGNGIAETGSTGGRQRDNQPMLCIV